MSQNPIEDQRDILDEILRNIEGVKKVYFQPPDSMKLQYPCLIYELSGFTEENADNNTYLSFPRYTLTLIDRNPESILQKRVKDLKQGCYVSFDRFFTSDNMNHWVYNLIFSKALW